jgi:hypothetical protein
MQLQESTVRALNVTEAEVMAAVEIIASSIQGEAPEIMPRESMGIMCQRASELMSKTFTTRPLLTVSVVPKIITPF